MPVHRPLRGYSWPGNIRELQSVLKQALLQASGPVLLPAFLPEPLGGAAKPANPPVIEDPEAYGDSYVLHHRLTADARDVCAEIHRKLDRILLPRVLELAQGNLLKAAHMLGIARKILRQKLRDLGLASQRTTDAGEDRPA